MTLPPDKPPDLGGGSQLGMTALGEKTPATTVTPSGLGDSVGRSAKMRSFAQIIADEKKIETFWKLS